MASLHLPSPTAPRRPLRRTREFNPCHHPAGNPAGGRFAPKGVGDCQPNRSIYGASTDDPGDPALGFEKDLKALEGGRDSTFVEMDKAYGLSASELKDAVAKGIATRLLRVVDAAAIEAMWGGLSIQRRYTAGDDLHNALDPDSETAKTQYEQKKQGIPDLETAQAEWENLEPEGADAPDPDSVQDEYDEYRQGVEDAASDQQFTDYLDRAGDEWDTVVDAAVEDVNTFLDGARELHTQIEAELPNAEHRYGDTTQHPELFADLGRAAPNLTPDVLEVAAAQHAYEQDGTQPFYADPRWIEAGGRLPEPLDTADLADITKAAVYEFIHEETEEQWREQYADAFEMDYSAIEVTFDSWYEGQYGIDPEDWTPPSKPDFDDWYRQAYGVAPDEDLTFDEWYQTKTGISVETGRLYAEQDRLTRSGDQSQTLRMTQDIASHLVGTWAETSSDTHPLAIAMQEEAREHFKLGTTNHEAYRNRLDALDETPGVRGSGAGVWDRVQALRSAHGPVLRGFLQSMYEHTQATLQQRGFGPDDYLTLFRGMRTASGDFSTVDLDRGDLVDVLLQPMSSYTTSLRDAYSFAGESRSGKMFATRIPVRAILGTPFSGYGAHNEQEFVVLGGRYTSAIFKPMTTYRDVSTAVRNALLRGTKKIASPPGRGERG